MLGKRGGGWVAVQGLLIAAVLVSAILDVGWSSSLAPFAYAAGGLLIALGAALLGAGGAGLGAALTPFPVPRPGEELRTTGIYALARHPMYGGGILFALGWSAIFATVAGLVLTVVLALFLELKSRREERWLDERHSGYADYRRRVRRRFIPFVW